MILGVEKLIFVTGFFVIATGANRRQLQGIARAIADHAKTLGLAAVADEGYEQARWILLDLGSVVDHLFHTETRAFYDLEMLWGDAPHLQWEAKKS